MSTLGQPNRPERRRVSARWLRVAVVAGLAGLTAAAGYLPSAFGQAQPKMDTNEENAPRRTRKPAVSAAELGRLRMLEIQSGAFREAHKDPGSQQLVGPPLSDREKVMHVMNRLAFGPKQGDVENVLLEGGLTDQWKGWVADQLKTDKKDQSGIETDIAKKLTSVKMTIAESHKEFPDMRGSGKDWRQPGRELQDAVLLRAVYSDRQLQEVLCEFWRNHFCIDFSTGESKPRSWAAADYEQKVVRDQIFGKFSHMVFASARHPAMLDYLDNQVSRANNWNENYARELMELHTVGVDRGYTDFDVIELSKVLTGWQFDRGSYEFKFNDGQHQAGMKKVMGQTIQPGYAGGEQAIMMLANRRETANFIATKLCKYFVNDAPSPQLIAKVEKVFADTKGDLPKVYEAIFYSPEFLDRGNFRAKFKTPFEFTVSALRAVDARVDDPRDTVRVLTKMGQEIYNCPDPTGYYDRAEAWLDSGVLTSRWDYSLSMCRGSIKGVTPNPKVFAKHKGKKVDDLYKDVVRELICDDIGDKTRQVLKEAADAGDIQRMYAILIGCPSFQQQ
ncbi:MAG TPA: DUF1800 domain-containing protein [Humisphaera sp.]